MKPLRPATALGVGASARFGISALRPMAHVEVAADGERCHWCDKGAVRREIVGRVYPRVYLGACKAHVANLEPIRADRAGRFDAIGDAKGEHIKQLSAAKKGHRPKFAKGDK